MNVFFSVSSHTDIDQSYMEDAKFLAREISSLGYNLIIGVAMEEGMPARVINEFHNNRDINLYTLEIYNEDPKAFPYIDFNYCDTTFDRTKNIYNNSDVLLILPGGTGTTAEIFSFIEEMRTTPTEKEMLIYNKDNHYKYLIKFIEEAINKRFNSESINEYLKFFGTKEEIVNYMTNKKIKRR